MKRRVVLVPSSIELGATAGIGMIDIFAARLDILNISYSIFHAQSENCISHPLLPPSPHQAYTIYLI